MLAGCSVHTYLKFGDTEYRIVRKLAHENCALYVRVGGVLDLNSLATPDRYEPSDWDMLPDNLDWDSARQEDIDRLMYTERFQ